MASRMIHYTIAKLITDKMNFKSRNQFLVGSLAPDMASYGADVHPLEKFSVEEANISYQTNMLADLKMDFLPYGDNFDLKIYNWNAIIDYIKKCVQVCLKEVELVIQGKEPDSPIPYMAPIDLKL